MGILEKFFPAKTAITSETIKAEIDYSESEIKRLQAEIGPKLAAIATMTDAEHVKTEADIAATKRAIARLDSRIALLNDQLPTVLAAEGAAAKATADAALRALAEACRKANEKEAAKLLAAYDEHASAIGGIIAKLKAMDGEREAINAQLRTNDVCEPVRSYVDIHRTTPGTDATEQRAKVPCWVYRYPGSPPDTKETKYQYEAPREDVRRATIGSDGEPVRGATEIHNYYGREIIITPTLEKREMVVSRNRAQPPRYEDSLNGVLLPPAFAGGKWHWPRQ
ncbi:hypothetical protein GGQ85_002202 [Nitrobacter vulgaris]|uniref:hypothetical protein n=1 Tax=Nitrobacter vulgaris TaxID=29421 RepID=UPI002854A744|nr:hypothetical protein [Nitrobacter vulgaris]MDR6304492.1 hypothetical protein [Nitrobacter vulgaris]